MPLGDAAGIGPDSLVTPTSRPLSIAVSDRLLGRVLDGLGNPIDGGGAIDGPDAREWTVDRPAPDPLSRPRVSRPLPLGVRVLDALLTVGEGQRVGIFAGSGVGKSTLMGQIARQTEADVNVIALVGERGREVVDFLEESLGAGGPGPLRRRLRDQRRAQPGAAEGRLRRHRNRRILPRSGPARAVHARLDHARRARPARGRPGRGRASGAPGLPAQRVRAAAAAARAHRDQRARIDHRALHRARRRRRHGGADRRRGARHPRRSRHPVARHRGAKPVARGRRAAVAVAPHERGRRSRAPCRRPALARAAGRLRAPARSDPARRLPARRRSAHRPRHRRAWTRSPPSSASEPTRARRSSKPRPASERCWTKVAQSRLFQRPGETTHGHFASIVSERRNERWPRPSVRKE